jgi:copper chaperone
MKKRLTVQGMTNGQSVTDVKAALQEVSGVTNVDVHLKQSLVIVDGDDRVKDSEMKSAVEDAGYKVASIGQI